MPSPLLLPLNILPWQIHKQRMPPRRMIALQTVLLTMSQGTWHEERTNKNDTWVPARPHNLLFELELVRLGEKACDWRNIVRSS